MHKNDKCSQQEDSVLGYDAMELNKWFLTCQDSVVVASSRVGMFLLDILTFKDETTIWCQNIRNCLPNDSVTSQKNGILG
jgi:hypothetical protein